MDIQTSSTDIQQSSCNIIEISSYIANVSPCPSSVCYPVILRNEINSYLDFGELARARPLEPCQKYYWYHRISLEHHLPKIPKCPPTSLEFGHAHKKCLRLDASLTSALIPRKSFLFLFPARHNYVMHWTSQLLVRASKLTLFGALWYVQWTTIREFCRAIPSSAIGRHWRLQGHF